MKVQEVSRALFLTATLCFLWTSDAVAPRRTRYRSSSVSAKARQSSGLFLTGYRRLGQPTLTTRFTPSITRCCKIGESAAKKKVSCQASDYLESKSINRNGISGISLSEFQRYAKVIIYKAEQCAVSKYAANFQKCCQYRQRYYKDFKNCSRNKRGSDRKACRDRVRMRYAAAAA